MRTLSQLLLALGWLNLTRVKVNEQLGLVLVQLGLLLSLTTLLVTHILSIYQLRVLQFDPACGQRRMNHG